jgi:hypothetical protein
MTACAAVGRLAVIPNHEFSEFSSQPLGPAIPFAGLFLSWAQGTVAGRGA